MSDNLRSRVQQALSQGVHFQYHVGAEDHLAYARRRDSGAALEHVSKHSYL